MKKFMQQKYRLNMHDPSSTNFERIETNLKQLSPPTKLQALIVLRQAIPLLFKLELIMQQHRNLELRGRCSRLGNKKGSGKRLIVFYAAERDFFFPSSFIEAARGVRRLRVTYPKRLGL